MNTDNKFYDVIFGSTFVVATIIMAVVVYNVFIIGY